MINTFRKSAHAEAPTAARLALVCSLLLMIAGCGKDSDDGEVRNSVKLPPNTDFVLNLYCADIGIYIETCVLDDPDNPYARVPFVDQDTKFDLANAAPSPKARFYLWATALARSSNGENQYYTARSLYELYDQSGSDLIKNQAIRAYRSVMDNYFFDVTFFSTADFGVLPEVFYPVTVTELSAANLIDGIGGTLFFDDADAVRNEFLARALMLEWGRFYDEDSGQVF